MSPEPARGLFSRFPLWVKFALLLAGFLVAVGILVLTNFLTAKEIQGDLAVVRDQGFPRFSIASSLVVQFDQIGQNFQGAAVEGERGLLLGNEAAKQRFLKTIATLLEVTPQPDQAAVIEIRKQFLLYFDRASQMTNLILADPTLADPRIADASPVVSDLHRTLQSNLSGIERQRRQSLARTLDRITETSQRQAQRDMVMGVVACIALLFFLVQMARRIIVPIESLSRLTAEVAKGNFEHAEEIRFLGRDEVGDLAESFAAMTRGLKETTVSKDYVDRIIESMADMMVVIDPDENILTVNRATTTLLGYKQDEILGKPASMIFPDVGKVMEMGMRRTFSSAVVRNKEKTFVARDGRHITVSISASILFSPSGQMQGFVCLAQDMTERKKAEEALRQANVELGEARDQALAANQTKSQFLANMSHELRTPLNAIIGYSEMLQEEATDMGEEAFVSDLKKIQAAGKHLLGLINDILDISKIEAGKMQLFLEDFAIQPLIADVVATVQPLVEKNANTLEIVCVPDIGTMHADVTRVRQVLFNLLSNATKFTKEGKITLTASREGTWVNLAVKDTGIGMTPAQVTKLFQPFTQAEAGTTRKYGGTGLGLTISKYFCTKMGGDLLLASEHGVGTTFTARLPSVVVEQKEESTTSDEEIRKTTRPGEAPIPESAKLVLVIDDDVHSRELLARYLTKDGFRVELASGGEEGLRLARDLQPDAITLDVMMPSVDGWQVLSALKADKDLANVPVLMITMMENQGMGQTLGASEYLRKPVDFLQLSAALRKHVGQGTISAS